MKNVLFVGGGLLAAALVGAVLFAVVQGAKGSTTSPCDKPKHHCIKVTVDPASNSIGVDVDPLTKKGTKHTIHWIIDNDPDTNQAFVFPAINGIQFTDSSGVFSCQIDDSNPRVFSCLDAQGTPKPSPGYKYKVTVTDARGSGNDPTPLDPHVINN